VQQRGLTGILGVEVARHRNLVEREPGVASGTGVHGDSRRRLVVLGHRQRDPLERRQRQPAVAQLGAKPRIGPQRRRRSCEYAEKVRQLTAGRKRAPQHRDGALWRRQVIVDLKSAHLCLHFDHQAEAFMPPSLLRLAYGR
jgi:hypothetical protein